MNKPQSNPGQKANRQQSICSVITKKLGCSPRRRNKEEVDPGSKSGKANEKKKRDGKKGSDKNVVKVALKKLMRTSPYLNKALQSPYAYEKGKKDCETCNLDKETYKSMMKSMKVVELIVSDVIVKAQNEMLENGCEEKEKNKAKTQGGNGLSFQFEIYCQQKNIDHNLKCVLVRLQKSLGDLILQLCYCKTKNPEDENCKKCDVPTNILEQLKFEYINLTNYIIQLFCDPPQKKPEICVACIKEELTDCTDILEKLLKSRRNLKVVMRNDYGEGKCCSRTYPHVHAVVQDKHVVLKFELPFQMAPLNSNRNGDTTDLKSNGSPLNSNRTGDTTDLKSNGSPSNSNRNGDTTDLKSNGSFANGARPYDEWPANYPNPNKEGSESAKGKTGIKSDSSNISSVGKNGRGGSRNGNGSRNTSVTASGKENFPGSKSPDTDQTSNFDKNPIKKDSTSATSSKNASLGPKSETNQSDNLAQNPSNIERSLASIQQGKKIMGNKTSRSSKSATSSTSGNYDLVPNKSTDTDQPDSKAQNASNIDQLSASTQQSKDTVGKITSRSSKPAASSSNAGPEPNPTETNGRGNLAENASDIEQLSAPAQQGKPVGENTNIPGNPDLSGNDFLGQKPPKDNDPPSTSMQQSSITDSKKGGLNASRSSNAGASSSNADLGPNQPITDVRGNLAENASDIEQLSAPAQQGKPVGENTNISGNPDSPGNDFLGQKPPKDNDRPSTSKQQSSITDSKKGGLNASRSSNPDAPSSNADLGPNEPITNVRGNLAENASDIEQLSAPAQQGKPVGENTKISGNPDSSGNDFLGQKPPKDNDRPSTSKQQSINADGKTVGRNASRTSNLFTSSSKNDFLGQTPNEGQKSSTKQPEFVTGIKPVGRSTSYSKITSNYSSSSNVFLGQTIDKTKPKQQFRKSGSKTVISKTSLTTITSVSSSSKVFLEQKPDENQTYAKTEQNLNNATNDAVKGGSQLPNEKSSYQNSGSKDLDKDTQQYCGCNFNEAIIKMNEQNLQNKKKIGINWQDTNIRDQSKQDSYSQDKSKEGLENQNQNNQEINKKDINQDKNKPDLKNQGQNKQDLYNKDNNEQGLDEQNQQNMQDIINQDKNKSDLENQGQNKQSLNKQNQNNQDENEQGTRNNQNMEALSKQNPNNHDGNEQDNKSKGKNKDDQSQQKQVMNTVPLGQREETTDSSDSFIDLGTRIKNRKRRRRGTSDSSLSEDSSVVNYSTRDAQIRKQDKRVSFNPEGGKTKVYFLGDQTRSLFQAEEAKSQSLAKESISNDVKSCNSKAADTFVSTKNKYPSFLKSSYSNLSQNGTKIKKTLGHTSTNLEDKPSKLLNKQQISEVIRDFGAAKLLSVSSPAECCMNNETVNNFKCVSDLPYSASLNSLPLDENDLEYITQAVKKLASSEEIALPSSCGKDCEVQCEIEIRKEKDNESEWHDAIIAKDTSANITINLQTNKPITTKATPKTQSKSKLNLATIEEVDEDMSVKSSESMSKNENMNIVAKSCSKKPTELHFFTVEYSNVINKFKILKEGNVVLRYDYINHEYINEKLDSQYQFTREFDKELENVPLNFPSKTQLNYSTRLHTCNAHLKNQSSVGEKEINSVEEMIMLAVIYLNTNEDCDEVVGSLNLLKPIDHVEYSNFTRGLKESEMLKDENYILTSKSLAMNSENFEGGKILTPQNINDKIVSAYEDCLIDHTNCNLENIIHFDSYI